MHWVRIGGTGARHHKSRRPHRGAGNATPASATGGRRRWKLRPVTRLRHTPELFLRLESAFSTHSRYHCQDVQYHFFRPRVSLGKVNAYKVEARPPGDPFVSRPWQHLLLLTVVISPILCLINHSHGVSRNTLSHGFYQKCLFSFASPCFQSTTIRIVVKAARSGRFRFRASRSLSLASAIPPR